MGQCISLYENNETVRIEKLERTVSWQQKRLDEYSETQSKLLKIIDSRIEVTEILDEIGEVSNNPCAKIVGIHEANENTSIETVYSTDDTCNSDSEIDFNVIHVEEYLRDFGCEIKSSTNE